MFDRKNVAIRIADIAPRLMEKDDKEINLLDIKCEISQLTVELVAELDPFMRQTLFTRTDSEVTPKLKGASFDLSLLPQEIQFRTAPDTDTPAFTILEGKIGVLHARRSKRSSAWRLIFTITCSPIGKDQLALMMDSYTKTRYCTFANAEADLFSELGKEQEKTAKAERASGIGVGSATAH